MSTVSEEKVWNDILKAVEKRLDHNRFETWFLAIRFDGQDEVNRILHLHALNHVVKDWVISNYYQILNDSLAELNLADYQIEWTVEREVEYRGPGQPAMIIPKKPNIEYFEPDDLKGLTAADMPSKTLICMGGYVNPDAFDEPEYEVLFVRQKTKPLRTIVKMRLSGASCSPLEYSNYIELLEGVICDRQEKLADVRFLNTNWQEDDFGILWLDEDEDTIVRYLAFPQDQDLFAAYKQVCSIQKGIIDSLNVLLQNIKNEIKDTVRRSKTHAPDYDVALSFAGEDREYVEQVANILHQLGIKVFYDKYEEANLWGKDLYTHLDDVYQRKSEYCVIFISKHYKNKLWTNHERESAQARAFQERREYILPVRFDATEIPGVRPTTSYLNIENRSPKDLAYLIIEKLGRNRELEDMIDYLKVYLTDYMITLDGTELLFESEIEQYQGKFPVRLMLEMYRMDMLNRMFLMPAIVPH